MGKHMSTFYADPPNDGQYCELHFNFKEEYAYLKYFTEDKKQFHREEFPNKSMRYVEDAAENWALGIKKLEKK